MTLTKSVEPINTSLLLLWWLESVEHMTTLCTRCGNYALTIFIGRGVIDFLNHV